jgi:hypothetical protein
LKLVPQGLILKLQLQHLEFDPHGRYIVLRRRGRGLVYHLVRRDQNRDYFGQQDLVYHHLPHNSTVAVGGRTLGGFDGLGLDVATEP